MSFWGWLTGRGKGKPNSLAAQSKLATAARAAPGQVARGAGARMPRAHPTRPARTVIPSNLNNPTHIDAGFDGEELAGFLLGLTIPCRSSWIDSARWDEDASNMTLTVDGKGYDFPGIGYEEAQVFAHYPSKGKWFWGVYRGRLGTTAGVTKAYVVDEGMRLPRRR